MALAGIPAALTEYEYAGPESARMARRGHMAHPNPVAMVDPGGAVQGRCTADARRT